MVQNVIIKGVGIFHPTRKVENEFYIEHFKKQGNDITHLLNHLGRKTRFLVDDENETAITLAVKAAKDALSNAHIKAEDLDMIVFVSDNPHYLSPTNALMINHELGAKNAHIVYDMNSNCTGAVTAIDQVSRYLKTNKRIRYALIAGSMFITPFARESDPIVYAGAGDAGGCVILENVSGQKRVGFIDSNYFTDSNYNYTIVYPQCGLPNVVKNSVDEDKKKLNWTSFDFDFLCDKWAGLITEMAKRNHVTIDQIGHYIFSQFSRADIIKTIDKLQVSHDKYTFIADKYGYTGVTSPIFTFYNALKNGAIKNNSYVVFCSVGAGYTMSSILYLQP
ncbi:MAG TPA: 3-oxoacyl-[acyl-carrier-protein] synthase III C-terminal domain-containing protein [Bacillota bacterium]